MSIKSDYLRQYKRVRDLYNRYLKKGYTINFKLPSKVKKPTKRSIERLSKITPKKILENSTYTLSTGETISGVVRRGQERRSAGKKAALTRKIKSGIKQTTERFIPIESISQTTEEESILAWIYDEIEKWEPTNVWSESLKNLKAGDKNRLRNILNGAVSAYGAKQVAQKLKENATRIKEIVESALYGSGSAGGKGFDTGRNKVDFDLVQFSEILKGEPLTSDEIMDLTALMEEQDFY